MSTFEENMTEFRQLGAENDRMLAELSRMIDPPWRRSVADDALDRVEAMLAEHDRRKALRKAAPAISQRRHLTVLPGGAAD